jgi:hypothetical protein
LKYQGTDVKFPDSLPGTSQIRREFGEVSGGVARLGDAPKILSAHSSPKKKSGWIRQRFPREGPRPTRKDWDRQSKEPERPESDKADPSPRNSRI